MTTLAQELNNLVNTYDLGNGEDTDSFVTEVRWLRDRYLKETRPVKTTQELFFEALGARLPKGYELNVDHAYANRGRLRIYRSGTFDSVIELLFDFQSGYASFAVPTYHAPSYLLRIGDRMEGRSFPAVRFDELESRVLSKITNTLKEIEHGR